MAWNLLQLHERDNFFEAATTMTVPLEADGKGGFGAGGRDDVCGGGGATTRLPSLRVHRDGTTTTSSTATKENEKPVTHTEDKISLFPQSQQSSNLKPDNFLEMRKRGKMSSATTVSTVA